MRIREKLKKRAEFLSLQHEFVLEPSVYRGKWSHYFGRTAPLYVEIGTGRGRFITTLASRHPDINYVGIEQFREVFLQAYKKKVAEATNNVALVCFNAFNIHEIFDEAEVDRIYLNFSDPWPKTKHENLRLTSNSFLAKYAQILKPGGEIHMKTDNEGLFDFSLESFAKAGWELQNVTRNLHNSSYEGNVMTEYEEYFSAQGKPIFRLEAIRP